MLIIVAFFLFFPLVLLPPYSSEPVLASYATISASNIMPIGWIPGRPHFTPHKGLNGGHIFLTLGPTLTPLSYILEGLV